MTWLIEELGPEVLTPPVLLRFRDLKMLSDEQIVSIELGRLMSGFRLSAGEHRIALLLGDETREVASILEDIVGGTGLTDEQRETVLIARILAIRRSWDLLEEPGFYVESEIDDWDSADDYRSVRFSSPPPPGSDKGMDAYIARLDTHLKLRIRKLRSSAFREIEASGNE